MATYALRTLVCGPLGNDIYLLSAGNRALVVDVPLESAAVIEDLLVKNGLTLETIVLTHSHFDHMAEAGPLADLTGALVMAHALDSERIRKPASPMMFPDLEVPPAAVSRELQDSDTVTLGEAVLTVLHTPGHTPGSICLYDEQEGVLISGDTLFAGSFGRYDLSGGDPVALRASLLRLAQLPPNTRVLPGHGPATTIARERWLANPPL